MRNEIYLYFDTVCYYSDEAACYDFHLLVSEGCPWVVEWDDGTRKRYVGTGEWQFASHAFQYYGCRVFIYLLRMKEISSGSSQAGDFAGY